RPRPRGRWSSPGAPELRRPTNAGRPTPADRGLRYDEDTMPARRLLVGISGASGSIYGVRLLETLRRTDGYETHLVLSASGKRTPAGETDCSVKDVEALAPAVPDTRDVAAAPASGSFKTMGMVIVPCSIKTVAALATGYGDTLMARAGDVTLKEGRPL